jgi:hypothetical protein
MRRAVLASLALLAGALLNGTSAKASLVWKDITYDLEETTTGDPLTNVFALKITGINAPADVADEGGGRTGINALSFGKPGNFASAKMLIPATGWLEQLGGLNSGGCDGSSNSQFCFDNTAINPNASPPIVPTTPFGAHSTQIFVFSETISSGDFNGYTPGFKIDWVGSNKNYNLVSEPITPDATCPGCGVTTTSVTPVSEPTSLALLSVGMLGAAQGCSTLSSWAW